MHYVPESACEFFQEPARGSRSDEAALAEVASLYALTAVVGLLLAGDMVLGLATLPGGWEWLRAPWGYRLALFAAVSGGARILYHSLENVLAGRFGADLALTTACLAAIALGEHQTAGLVVFISLIGESVEGFTLSQAKRAIRRTFEQRPETAQLIRDGLEREIAAEALQPGDLVLVRAGDRIPADGRIVTGMSSINESLISGESLPVEKTTDDAVIAGTVNLTSALTIRVEKSGANTALAEMERLVRQATSRKMRCERTADRFARWFLPAVLAIAAITLLAWRVQTGTWQAGWLPALGVLVVACPCPLILATPCAVMAALAWLARRGIVVKGSAALERLAGIDVFAFDKTGTLSEGDLSLGSILSVGELSTTDLLQLAASAERPSAHPIAQLLRTAAQSHQLDLAWPKDFAAHLGAGVTAQVTLAKPGPESASESSARQVVIGSERLLADRNVTMPAAGMEAIHQLLQAGQTPLLIGVDGQLAGVLGIQETLREESAAVLRELKQLGIRRLVMLTGDRELPAQAAALRLALFDHVAAQQLPEDKAHWIEAAQKSGQRVAMIGDGLNDGPALAAADVGLAVCRSGSVPAGEAGEILLLGDPLRPLPGLVRLSRALVENIGQSLYWFALGVNGAGVLACSTGWLSPVAAAVFHEAASLLVLLNALRLLRFQDRPSATKTVHFDGNAFLEQWAARLSPGRLLAKGIRGWRLTLQLAGCGLAIAWLASQIVMVRDDEAVVVLRGGQYHETLSAGWSWRWPWPLERLVRLRPSEVKSVSVGFRTGESVAKPTTEDRVDLEWTSSHEDAHFRGVPEESLYLTGDEVAVELTAEVHYRIADVQRFALSGGLQPDELLRSAAESVLRAAIAAQPLDAVLTEQRTELEQRCREDLQQRIAGYDVGLDVLAVHWLDVHPPRPVVDAYRQVSDAWEQSEQAVNEAEALATRTLFGAAGETAIRQLDRRGKPQNISDWTLSDDAWKSLSTPDAAGDRTLSGTAAAVLVDAEAAAVQRRQASRGQADRLQQLLAVSRGHPELSRQHWYWTAVVEALSGKPFTLVDPGLTGRRQIYLGDMPGTGGLPPPIFPEPPPDVPRR